MTIFEGQPVIYGLPFIAFPSDDGDSTFFVTEGHVTDQRRMLALFSRIRRAYGFDLLLKDVKYADLIEHAWMKINQEDDEFHFSVEDEQLDDSYVPVTLVEW